MPEPMSTRQQTRVQLIAPDINPGGSDGFIMEVGAEVRRAREKFPTNAHMYVALVEEVGEVAEALLEEQGAARVRAECVQVAAMAWRLALEGDGDFPWFQPAEDRP